MPTVRRPLPALVLAAGLAVAATACDYGTPPEAPAEIEESIQETGPEVIEDGAEGEAGY